MNDEIKLHQALGEMKRTAEQLYPLFNAINDEIDKQIGRASCRERV